MSAVSSLKSDPNEITVEKVRLDFPQLSDTKIHGKSLVYLDNAATTLKPKSVIEAIDRHYSKEVSNIHRGVHYLSEKGTCAYEETRKALARFINAASDKEVLFTKGTTDSLNLVAKSYGRSFLKAGDEIIISEMEHHSNIVPWQMIRDELGLVLKVIPVTDQGELDFEAYKVLLTDKTKLVSVVAISNTLGTVNPIKEIIKLAHQKGAVVVVDAAQAVAHMPIDVQDLDADFVAFSAHKMFGPTGIGALYGKENLLNQMPPVDGGGAMIDQVTFEKTTYNVIPQKFEAGTPHIAGGIAWKPAIEYIESLGFEWIEKHGSEILTYATDQIKKIPGVKLIGEAKQKMSVLSFVVEGAHPQDIGTLIDRYGVAIRTGHHCTQPLMKRYEVSATCRASFTVYNTKEDVDAFIVALKKVIEML